MEASAPQSIRFLSHETNEQIRWFDPGSGSQGSRSCGIMRSWGHVTGGMVHAEAGFVRCQRPGCPECFDKPRGYLDRCRDRILAGIGKSLDEGWEEDLQELVVAPYFAPGSEQMLLDATYRRGLIRSVRLEHSARVGIRCGCGHAGEVHDPSGTCQAKGCAKFGHPCRGEGLLTPGAYVIHPIAPLGRIASDSCPDLPHLHLFFRGRCEGSRKPGLYTVLRDATRGTGQVCGTRRRASKDRPWLDPRDRLVRTAVDPEGSRGPSGAGEDPFLPFLHEDRSEGRVVDRRLEEISRRRRGRLERSGRRRDIPPELLRTTEQPRRGIPVAPGRSPVGRRRRTRLIEPNRPATSRAPNARSRSFAA